MTVIIFFDVVYIYIDYILRSRPYVVFNFQNYVKYYIIFFFL